MDEKAQNRKIGTGERRVGEDLKLPLEFGVERLGQGVELQKSQTLVCVDAEVT